MNIFKSRDKPTDATPIIHLTFGPLGLLELELATDRGMKRIKKQLYDNIRFLIRAEFARHESHNIEQDDRIKALIRDTIIDTFAELAGEASVFSSGDNQVELPNQ